MSEYAPRCPFCANVLKHQPSLWERIGLKSSAVQCPTCLRKCEGRDAHTMGAAYYHWAEEFRKELAAAVDSLPLLTEAAMHRALGRPPAEDTRLMPSFEELVRTCLRHQRTVLVEMARGREATLEVAVVSSEEVGQPDTVAVLGTASSESGSKELEQLIARTGMHHYVLYNYPSKEGAEARIKRAVHGKAPRSLTEAHVQAMHAEPHGGNIQKH